MEDIKAVIFDLDGTLIDTEKIYRVLWPQSVRELGFDMKDEHYLQMRSLGRPFAPLKMLEWFGDGFDYDAARKIRSGHFNKYIEEHGIQRKKRCNSVVGASPCKGYHYGNCNCDRFGACNAVP